MLSIETAADLPDDLRVEAEALVDAATAHDGVVPFNELGRLALRGDREGTFWWVRDAAGLHALAWRDAADGGVQLVVHPSMRDHGLGTELAQTTLDDPASTHWWAFGTLESALLVADRLELPLTRQLVVMERDLLTHPAEPVPEPQGLTITGFTEADVDDLVLVNALAFAHHPEQGRLTADDVRLRMAEDWFDPEGLILARSTQTGELLGFHWTKLEDRTGEVYVIGVHPQHEGRGLGRGLLALGLQHLQQRGATRVQLYADAAEERVVRMYTSANFVVRNRDSSFSRDAVAGKD